ncbi:hypothetical protein JX265_011863 [Neoarthrinium moseri]|uniref:Ecp2 effector protein-like domain-containing protein n=1 Tax=Neoarthrinium moseri TaxID=1658444 RepID=A0A9P9WBZ1_9PEZI|nr:hypothetical protein JX265_011863 [Neoarthrinium moseri]
MVSMQANMISFVALWPLITAVASPLSLAAFYSSAPFKNADDNTTSCQNSSLLNNQLSSKSPRAEDCQAIGSYAAEHHGEWEIPGSAGTPWLLLHFEGTCALVARPGPGNRLDTLIGSADVAEIAGLAYGGSSGTRNEAQGTWERCGCDACSAAVQWWFTGDF